MITQIGKHRVKHGSITKGIADLMGEEKADIIYTDPPWGQGNITYWQTINKRHTGATPEQIEYNDFINMLFSTYNKYGKNLLFVEYGIKWRDDIIRKGQATGWVHNTIVPLRYGSSNKLLPLDLHIFSRQPITLYPEYLQELKGLHGYKTLQVALKPFAQPGMLILDPMCGMGYTAQVAVDYHMTFRGNELNSKRLGKTITRLEKDPRK